MKLIFLALSIILAQNCGNKTVEQKQKKTIAQVVKETNKSSMKNDTLKETFNNLKITYEESLNLPKELINKLPKEALTMINNPIRYHLLHNGYSTRYSIDKDFVKEKRTSTDSKNSNSFSLAEYSTYKNYQNNNLIIKTGVKNDIYLINTKIKQFDWAITKERKNIGKYNCIKATTTRENKKIIAYYTDEIPVNEGPSIYNGLPGLIIYLKAPDRTYKATKIEFKENIKITKFKIGKNTSEKEYKKITDKIKNNSIIEESIEKHYED